MITQFLFTAVVMLLLLLLLLSMMQSSTTTTTKTQKGKRLLTILFGTVQYSTVVDEGRKLVKQIQQ
jgi:hypothetical protein